MSTDQLMIQDLWHAKHVCLENLVAASCLDFDISKIVILINYSYPLDSYLLLLQITLNR